mgnify:CR=1 FL=1
MLNWCLIQLISAIIKAIISFRNVESAFRRSLAEGSLRNLQKIIVTVAAPLPRTASLARVMSIGGHAMIALSSVATSAQFLLKALLTCARTVSRGKRHMSAAAPAAARPDQHRGPRAHRSVDLAEPLGDLVCPLYG